MLQAQNDPQQRKSLPTRERGLKSFTAIRQGSVLPSLPTRERGLKCCLAPSGCGAGLVAPHAGAWIEILLLVTQPPLSLSLPTRERGLKS